MLKLSDEFNGQFLLIFVSFMLRDGDFLSRVRRDLEPEYFTDEYMCRIVRLIFAFHDKHGGAPDRFIFQEIDDLKKRGLLSDTLHAALSLYIDELYRYKLQDKDYVLGRFSDFVMFAKIESKLGEFIKAAQGRKYGDCKQLMQEMLSAPKVLDLGRRYEADPVERIERRSKEDMERCWTLIPEIDSNIEGLRKGELGLWQSRQSSDGKTAALLLLARNFAFQGKKVLFQFLEGTEEGIEDRLDQCFAGLTRKELQEAELIERRVKRYLSKGEVWVKKFPAYDTRVSDLQEHAKMLGSVSNFYPDVVLLDYLDLCAPETPSLRGDLHAWGREVCTRMLQWLQEDQLVGWSAMQSNREAGREAVAGQVHTGGSITKTQLAHLILSINRSKEDRQLRQSTISVVKNRDGRSGFEIILPNDLERMAFWEFRPTIPGLENAA